MRLKPVVEGTGNGYANKEDDMTPKKGSLMDAVSQVLSRNREKTYWTGQELYEEIVKQGLAQAEPGKTPHAALADSIYTKLTEKAGR